VLDNDRSEKRDRLVADSLCEFLVEPYAFAKVITLMAEGGNQANFSA